MDEEPTDNDPESMSDVLNQNKKSNHHKESTYTSITETPDMLQASLLTGG